MGHHGHFLGFRVLFIAWLVRDRPWAGQNETRSEILGVYLEGRAGNQQVPASLSLPFLMSMPSPLASKGKSTVGWLPRSALLVPEMALEHISALTSLLTVFL